MKKPDIIFTEQFDLTRSDLPPASDLFGYVAEVLVRGTHNFNIALIMQKEMTLEEIVAPVIAEAARRGCEVDEILFIKAERLSCGSECFSNHLK